jgi:hypothetical protein
MSIELNFDSGYDLKDAIAGLILLATSAYHIADVFTDTRTAILNKQVKPTFIPDAPCSVTNPST